MAYRNEDYRQKDEHSFPPCTENCYRINGGHEEKESSNHSFYFFKVMIGDYARKLRIPPAVVPKLINETDENMALEGPNGHRWNVKLWRGRTEMEFRQGWDSFVRDHRTEFGDFMVFKYICRSYFRVKIFGRSGCEKDFPVFETEKTLCDLQKRCPAIMNGKFPVDSVSYQEGKFDPGAAAVLKSKSSSSGGPRKKLGHCQPSLAGKKHRTPKSEETKAEEKSYQGAYYLSCRRPVTIAEKKKALGAAKTFTSNKPFHLLQMKPSNVYVGFWLNIPKKCGDDLKLPRERTEVTLVDPNNKEWDVKYLGDRSAPGLSGGWRSLSIDNNLEEGDVCIFERVDDNKNKIKIRVHIYRVVEKCTPYKKMEGTGKGINDSIETPIKPSKKKMKALREDFAINLSAKVFEPKQGKDAKQMQAKKEKASNESNCHELPKSKCSPSISESHHRSLLMKDLLTEDSIVQAANQENPSCNLMALLPEAATSCIDTNAEPNITRSSEENGDNGSSELTRREVPSIDCSGTI